MSEFWAVAQTISGTEHVVRRDIEEAGFGAFVPTYARIWAAEGRMNAREYPLLRGYVFFKTSPDAWSPIASIDGVFGVLATAEGEAKRVSAAEMASLMLAHASGAYNQITVPPRHAEKRRRRRHRPSKRIRANPVPCSPRYANQQAS